MARDHGLEDLLSEDLAGTPGLSTRPMFGGLAWMKDDHLVCAARHDGLLIRLGAGRDAWALALSGIVPMRNGDRLMKGWIWADEAAYGDDLLRRRLIGAALDFVRSLPRKVPSPSATPWDFPETPGRPARARQPKA